MLLVLFNCVYILFLILEMSEKEELNRLRKSHKVNIRYMESLKIEIQALLYILTEIDSLVTKASENSSVNKTTLPRALSFSHSAKIVMVKQKVLN